MLEIQSAKRIKVLDINKQKKKKEIIDIFILQNEIKPA